MARTPTAEIRLRPARPADLDRLVALEEQTFDSDRVSRRQWRHHLSSSSCTLLVAARGAELLGVALLFFRAGSTVARLYSIAVAGSTRGLGLGRRLLLAVERKARRRGARALRLEVRHGNAAAIALYASHGYLRIGHRRHYYEDGADAWRYEKRWLVDREVRRRQ